MKMRITQDNFEWGHEALAVPRTFHLGSSTLSDPHTCCPGTRYQAGLCQVHVLVVMCHAPVEKGQVAKFRGGRGVAVEISESIVQGTR